MAAAGDLVTVLYRPRETMQRVLQGSDRWAPQLVILASLVSSIKDTDTKELSKILPGLGLSVASIILLGLLLSAIFWIIGLYLFGWITAIVGRRMGGEGTAADVRAALAWATVPLIWSVVVVIPFEIARRRMRMAVGGDATTMALDFFAQGGCSLMVLMVMFQLLMAAWCIWIASCTVGEAQKFSSGKGFVSIAIPLALPFVIVLAVIASQHF